MRWLARHRALCDVTHLYGVVPNVADPSTTASMIFARRISWRLVMLAMGTTSAVTSFLRAWLLSARGSSALAAGGSVSPPRARCAGAFSC